MPDTFALAWLMLLLGLSASYGFFQFQRTEYSLWETCLYIPTYLMGRMRWRVQFLNEAPPEIRSGAVLVANHRSSVDPFFVQLAARRRVHWMVAKEFCQHPLFGILLRALQVIPTNRSGMDTASTKAAIRITGEGRLVGMFPEGKLNRTESPLLPIRSGAALVASRSNAPMIPLYIQGSPYRDTVWSPVLMQANVRITFGEPIYNQSSDALAEENMTSEDSQGYDPDSNGRGDQAEVQGTSSPDEQISRWGKQIVALAGQPDFPVTLASARSRRRKEGNP